MQRLKEIEQTAVKSSTWAFIHMTMSGISTFYTRTLLKKRGVELTPKSKLYYRLLVGRKKKQWLTSTFKITQQMPFTQPDLSCIFLNTDQDCGAPERIKCCLWQPLSTRVAKGHTRKVRWHQEHTLTSDGNFCRVLTVLKVHSMNGNTQMEESLWFSALLLSEEDACLCLRRLVWIIRGKPGWVDCRD